MTANERYSRFYVNRKGRLSKLIKKHSGEDIMKMTHGDAADLYIGLLQTSPEFKSDVDKETLAGGYKNAVPGLGTIVNTVGNVVSGISQVQAEKEKQDTALYDAILKEQGTSDTGKLVIIGGISLLVLITAVIVAVKLNKRKG